MSTLTAAQAAQIILATRRKVDDKALAKARQRPDYRPIQLFGEVRKARYARTSVRVSGLEPSFVNPRQW